MQEINHPKHYTSHLSGVEPIEICEHLSFCLGCAFKYIIRRNEKHNEPLTDLRKALWYLKREAAAYCHGYPYAEGPFDAEEAAAENNRLNRIMFEEEEPFNWILQAIVMNLPGGAAWMLQSQITAMEADADNACSLCDAIDGSNGKPAGSPMLRAHMAPRAERRKRQGKKFRPVYGYVGGS